MGERIFNACVKEWTAPEVDATPADMMSRPNPIANMARTPDPEWMPSLTMTMDGNTITVTGDLSTVTQEWIDRVREGDPALADAIETAWTAGSQ